MLEDYTAERLRQAISAELGWRESRLDAEPGLVAQVNDLHEAMETLPDEGPPPHEFWVHWVDLARVWSTVAGRAAGGSTSAARELDAWAAHELVVDKGWKPVEEALSALASSQRVVPSSSPAPPRTCGIELRATGGICGSS